MATKARILKGTDCFADTMELSVVRDKEMVKVTSSLGDRFCCRYADLAKLVKDIAPPTPKKK
jgi:hypothetical protein